MASHSESQMRRAERLINAGRKKEALELLRPLTESNPDQAKLWWLVACSAAKPETQRKALEKALRIRPNFPEAQRMLDLVKSQSSGTLAALQTAELLKAEVSDSRTASPSLLLLVPLPLIFAVGVGGFLILQQLTPQTTAEVSPTSDSTRVAEAMVVTAEATQSAAETTPDDGRIHVQAADAFSFELPQGDCWTFEENATGGLFTCTVDDGVLFSGSLNTPYVIEAMNEPEQSKLTLDDRTITIYEGHPFPGIAGGDALWLTVELDGKTASLLAVTSADAEPDTLDPYKDALYAMLLYQMGIIPTDILPLIRIKP